MKQMKNLVIRQEPENLLYDGKGNIISKDIHKETTSELTDSYEEEKMFFDITKD